MQQLLIISTLQTLFIATAAILLVWLLLRLLDKALGRKFGEIYDVIIKDSKATALYFGLRFIGACVLVGLAL